MSATELQATATVFQAGFLAGFMVAFLLVSSGIKAILRRGWKDDDED